MPVGLTSSDYRMVDFLETITYTSVGVSPTPNRTITVKFAAGLDPDSNEVPLDGGMATERTRFWWLPAAEMSGITPKQGDFLVDADGAIWYLRGEISILTAKTIYGVETVEGR